MVAQDDKFRVLRKLPEVRFEEELRGYSKSQVDRVLQGLAPLADDVAALQKRLADAEARAAGAEARLVEAQAAPRSASEAPAAVAPPVAVAAPPSFDETLSKTLLLAQRTADQTVAEAKVEAEALVGEARAEAEQLKAENARARSEAADTVAKERHQLLEAAHAEVQAKVELAEASLAEAEGAQRSALLSEIAEFTSTRDALGEDIERLEGHLAQRREVIRAALADIATVVDDPSRLHSEMPPVAGEPVSVPAPGNPGVVLDVDGLDDLAPDTVEASTVASVSADAGGVESVGSESGTVQSSTVASDSADASTAEAAVGGTGTASIEAEAAADLMPTGTDTASSTASLLGELDSPVGDPTEAVPMVQLLADEPTAADDADSAGLVVDVPAADDSDDDDLDLDDWVANPSPSKTGAVIVDEVRWDDTPPTSASPADFGFEDAADHVPASVPGRGNDSLDELSRPAWADAVPDIEPTPITSKSEDPFLDELRRATGDDAETDVALERFLTDNPDDDDRRSGWFSRRK